MILPLCLIKKANIYITVTGTASCLTSTSLPAALLPWSDGLLPGLSRAIPVAGSYFFFQNPLMKKEKVTNCHYRAISTHVAKYEDTE
jgi:hypothetical protein